MGFAEGMASGAATVRSAINAGVDVQNAMYRGKVQQDNLDQMAQAKAERDYLESERNIIASAANTNRNPSPAPVAAPPAQGASFGRGVGLLTDDEVPAEAMARAATGGMTGMIQPGGSVAGTPAAPPDDRPL